MIYHADILNKFIKTLFRDGKYTKSSKTFHKLLFRLYKLKHKDPNFIVITALFNISPLTKMSSKERTNHLLNVEQSFFRAFHYLNNVKKQSKIKGNYNKILSEELIKAYSKSKHVLSNNFYHDDSKTLIN
ncbi:hypothetical protein AB834_03615 [PVC group bacterium (ex Bugula neritina AB1)]|nr:hypothetical protein AB834_03615 [PVC group bacterium (ex Bugula neritina AB1)]